MSNLSDLLKDRVKRMRCGRHLGNAKVETIAAWAEEVAVLEAHSQRLAALVEGLKKRIKDTLAILPDWPEVDAAAISGVLSGIEDDLAAHGFGPEAQAVQEGPSGAAGGASGIESGFKG